MSHTIPEEEIKRINSDAWDWAQFELDEEIGSCFNGYKEGAKTEYIASLQRQSEFIQWLDVKIAGVKMCYEDIHNSTNANSAYGLVLQYLKETRQQLLITNNQPLTTNIKVMVPIPCENEIIAQILRDNITFSGQVGDYVIHGAIEKILSRQKDMAIEFAVFIFKGYRIRSYSDQWMWERLGSLFTPIIQLFTTEQVYSIFIESLNKQV